MGKMVLIGGGVFSETVPFLREIVALSAKKAPEILIVPTAGKDGGRAFSYWRDEFAQLGGQCRPLYLVNNPPSRAAIEEAVLSSDIVYVPGGDTLFMVRLWRKLGVDKVFKKAYQKDIVLSGRSAGAACWFRHSLGGEPPTKGLRFYSYLRIKGIGLIDAAFCAHYQDRREPFRVFLQQFGGVGIGIEDNRAIVIEDGHYRLRSLDGQSRIYRVCVGEKMVDNFRVPALVEDVIEETEEMQPLHKLLQQPGEV